MMIAWSDHWQFTTFADNHLLSRAVSSVSLLGLYQLNNIHAFQNLPENYMPLVQPWGLQIKKTTSSQITGIQTE